MTKKTEAGLLGHGVFTTKDGEAKSRFTVYGDSVGEIEKLIREAQKSPLTESVREIQHSYRTGNSSIPTPGNATRDIFVEFNPENSIDNSFVSRGFVYDGPVRIYDGLERWTVVAHQGREKVKAQLAAIEEEMDAEIKILHISSYDHSRKHESALDLLSARQREIFYHARDNGYYSWPREATSRDLAADLDISKTTFLEHLRKAESKILNQVE
ncbi:helix-turn-helix domain-containing protein [Haladaptatus sp. NG-WS-4]